MVSAPKSDTCEAQATTEILDCDTINETETCDAPKGSRALFMTDSLFHTRDQYNFTVDLFSWYRNNKPVCTLNVTPHNLDD